MGQAKNYVARENLLLLYKNAQPTCEMHLVIN